MRQSTILIFLLAAMLIRASARQQSHAADPVAVQIEGNTILESRVRQLGQLQVLTQTVPDSRDRRVQRLIEQWIVMDSAKKDGLAAPSDQLIDFEEAKITGQFASPDAYAAKLREVGLSEQDVRQLLSRQILIDRYLDQKFRPSVQIGQSEIETYYQNEWLPALSRENQSTVPLGEVEDQIREVLTQQAIRDRSAKWITEAKSRLKIEQAGSTTDN